ncbi:hypothetical protein [Pedobacter sp. B4-66]|uniref:hypothetical protein n=1 Tax=Pedobacter sp. B4-66 TaxID=2817280 RepID=UPI001BDB1994|nr:hypothetical protein [Pedobacter sp. B4-66]
MPENRTPHILNTSATLLGLCFIVLTSLKVAKMSDSTLIDETTALAIILFMTACILSFLSMKRRGPANYGLERTADIIFIFGLLVLFLTTMMVTFNVIK